LHPAQAPHPRGPPDSKGKCKADPEPSRASPFSSVLCCGCVLALAGVEQLAPRCTALRELFVDDPRCELHVLHPIIIACAHSLRRVVIDCDKGAPAHNEASVSSVLWLIRYNTVQCTVCSVQCTVSVHSVQCTVYSEECTVSIHSVSVSEGKGCVLHPPSLSL